MCALILVAITHFLLPQKFPILLLMCLYIGGNIRINGTGKNSALRLTDLKLFLCHPVSPPKIALYFSKSIVYDITVSRKLY